MAEAPTTSRSVPWALLVAGLVISAGCVVLAAVDLLPLGVAGEWEWLPRIRDLQLGAFTLLAVLLCCLTCLYTARVLQRTIQPRRLVCVGLVGLCIVSSLGLLLGPLADDPVVVASLGATTTSIGAMGYYGLAVQQDSLRDGFRMYVTRDTSLGMPGRIQTHPPGPYLWAHWGRRLTQAYPALTEITLGLLRWRYGFTAQHLHEFAFGYAMPGSINVAEAPGAWLNGLAVTLAGSLLPLTAFLLVAGVADRRTGLVAALLAMSLPSVLAFVPSIDGMAAVLGMLPVIAFTWAVRRSSWFLAICSGLALAAAVFWTTGLVAVIGPMTGLALLVARDEAGRKRWLPLVLLIATGITVLLVYGLLYLLTGYNLSRDFQVMSAVHHGQVGGRSYWLWLPMNLWDFVLFMGPALALMVGASLREQSNPTASGIVLGMLVTLLVILFSGVTRGEVGRIWLFMMPLLLPTVAFKLAGLPDKQPGQALALLTAAQIMTGLGLYSVLELVHP